jgi:D-erythrulose 4-kinase
MGYLPTDPANFASEAIDGFAAAYPRHVRRIDGGVMRLAPIPSGQVGAVVTVASWSAGLSAAGDWGAVVASAAATAAARRVFFMVLFPGRGWALWVTEYVTGGCRCQSLT